jgi:2-amino-4-hydroxy-6-hydroxymethyldihydropteridine diphosphokinase
MATPAWIGLGSNLGDRKGILDAAVAALADWPGVVILAVSSYHETRPVGGPPGQGPFLNAAASLETTLDPHQLLAVLQEVEHRAGRVRAARWGERTLDLDLLIFGDKFLDSKDLKLPHPRLAFRRFVLAPLAEIAPTVIDRMTNRTIADLLANLDRRPRLLAIDGSNDRLKAIVFGRLIEELPGFGIAQADLESPPDRGGDPLLGRFEFLDRKAEVLRASHWAIETLRVPWIVADFDLGLDLRRASLFGRMDFPRSAWERRAEDYLEGIRRVIGAARNALTPTLTVILPEDDEQPRYPGRLTVPQLRPESDEPDAIVGEVLATCRAIEGV